MALYPEDDLITDPLFRKRKGRIVIVGNSAVDKDHSEFVDSADFVIRFSKVLHFSTGLVGSKTDILCLRAFKAFYQEKRDSGELPQGRKFELERYMSAVNSFKPWNSCREVWFIGKWLNYHEDIKVYLDHFPRFADVNHRLIHVCPLHDFLFGLKLGEKEPITQGVIVVLHLLMIRLLKLWKIQLVGFQNFRQAPGDISHTHDVEKDKKILQELHEAGYIELCD